MQFSQHQLSNGLQIVAELTDAVQSVACGFFVRTGARDETPEVSGVSHFLEHLVFKGTPRHTAYDVNRIFDEVGAKYNASTSEEVTLFYAAVLPEYLPTVFDLLSDILRPSLRDDDVNMERNVILEEIGMYDDLPTFTAYEKAMQAHFAGHPLSQSILGTNQSITDISVEQIRQYHAQQYVAGNVTLAVAGNYDWDKLVSLAEAHCGAWPAGRTERLMGEVAPESSTQLHNQEHLQQQHIAQMAVAPSGTETLRFSAELLSVIVGDDTGSRLYWELVDPGHAESADFGYNEYDGVGSYMTFLSGSPEQTAQNLSRIAKVYDQVNRNGVTAEELELAQNKVSSRIVLRSERPMGRLSSLGSNWVYRENYRSIQDDLDAVQSVTLKSINELLSQYPLQQTTTVGIGPLTELASWGS